MRDHFVSLKVEKRDDWPLLDPQYAVERFEHVPDGVFNLAKAETLHQHYDVILALITITAGYLIVRVRDRIDSIQLFLLYFQ